MARAKRPRQINHGRGRRTVWLIHRDDLEALVRGKRWPIREAQHA